MDNTEIKRGFYALIPSVVLSDKRLSATAKLVYGEIHSLADQNGLCYPSNDHFAEILGIAPRSASRCISQLRELGLINYEIEVNNQRTIQITLDKNFVGVGQKRPGGVGQKRPHSNTHKRITQENIISPYILPPFKKLENLTEEVLEKISDRYQIPMSFVRMQLEALKNYCESTGKTYKNYEAALKNFCLRDMKNMATRPKKGGVVDATNL